MLVRRTTAKRRSVVVYRPSRDSLGIMLSAAILGPGVLTLPWWSTSGLSPTARDVAVLCSPYTATSGVGRGSSAFGAALGAIGRSGCYCCRDRGGHRFVTL